MNTTQNEIIPVGQTRSKKQKTLIVAVCIGTALLLAVLSFILFLSLRKIDPSAYLSEPIFTGCNTIGTASIKFDREALITDVIGKTPDSWFSEEFFEWQNRYDEISKGIKLEYNSEGLSNGDEFTVKIAVSGVAADKIKSVELTYTVKGLKDVETHDVFKDIELSVTGTSGNATAKINKLTDRDIIVSCSFAIEPNYGIKNGDAVIVTIKNVNQLYDKYEFIPTETTKTFIVSGLEEYATIETLPRSIFQGFAEQYLQEKNTNISEENTDFLSYSTAQLYGIYFLTEKEDALFAKTNEVRIIVSYDKYVDGEYRETIYDVIYFDNITIDSDGKTAILYEDRKSTGFFYTDINEHMDELEDDYNITKIE